MSKENIVFKDRLYPAIELFDFDTADGYYGLFISAYYNYRIIVCLFAS